MHDVKVSLREAGVPTSQVQPQGKVSVASPAASILATHIASYWYYYSLGGGGLLLLIVLLFTWRLRVLRKRIRRLEAEQGELARLCDKLQAALQTAGKAISAEIEGVKQRGDLPTLQLGLAFYGEKWVVAGASVIGCGHVEHGLPCQDYHEYKSLGGGRGIAVVADGAGIAKRAEIGVKIAAKRGQYHFERLVQDRGWQTEGRLPDEQVWEVGAFQALLMLRADLAAFSQKHEMPIGDLSGTLMVLELSLFGLMVTHIGDGRGCYCMEDGQWEALFSPHKGEESNMTFFVSAPQWMQKGYSCGGIPIPESRVIVGKPRDFALMSDGCQGACWEYNQRGKDGRFYDPNRPFVPFFESLTAQLLGSYHATEPQVCAANWHGFLQEGNQALARETDDKTMVFGVME